MLVILTAMLLFAGWVIDIMRSYSVHNQLANATDAALASAILSEQPEQTALQVAQANMNSGLGKHYRQELVMGHRRSEHEETLSLQISFQPNSLNTVAEDGYLISSSSRASRKSNKAEIVFMLDISGSMKGRPLQQTKRALLAFADKLYAVRENNPDYVISVVPASGNVNTGPIKEIYLGAMRRYDHAQVKYENRWQDMFSLGSGRSPAVPGRKRRAMCRDFYYEGTSPGLLGVHYFRNLEKAPRYARRHSRRILRPLVPPVPEQFADGTPLDPAVYPSTNPRQGYKRYHEDKAIFDDIDCHLNPIAPFITEKSEFDRVTKGLVSGMHTNNAEGMVWAARLLSPYWQGVWDKHRSYLPRYYGDKNSNKYVVIFSDGEHIKEPAYRDKKMKLICTQLKSPKRGVKIISVNFGGRASQRLMESCASGPEFYHTASLFNVDHVFEQIAEQVISSSLVE